MKIINYEQGSDEWISWRKTITTATDASVIMGVNPYCTLNELRSRKLGLIPETECNAAMQRGKDLEGEARFKFEQECGFPMIPKIVESSEFPFLGASLDGMCITGKHILEIKCPGKKGMIEAKKGIVKPLYIAQIQHQLLCTNADMCYYYCYDGAEGHTIEVYPDLEWQKEYIPKAEEFWMSLIFKE